MVLIRNITKLSSKCLIWKDHLENLCLTYSTLLWSILNELTPWLESASELYRPSNSRLSVKLVPTFAHRGVSHGQCGASRTAVISISRKHFNRTALSTSLEHSLKLLHWNELTPVSASELYRPSDRCLSEKTVPKFPDHSYKLLHSNTQAIYFTRTNAKSISLHH
jgi:hypothetical protein